MQAFRTGKHPPLLAYPGPAARTWRSTYFVDAPGGCCEVEVSTEASNQRARKFYRGCGFGYEGVLFELHLRTGRPTA
jgi:RimJ/RimL family protein N-acetyltransferase